MKKCVKCGGEKDLSAFNLYGNTCKVCRKIVSHEHYVLNKDKYKERNYKWRDSHPEEIKLIRKKHRQTESRIIKEVLYSAKRRSIKSKCWRELDWAERLTIETLYTTSQKLGLHVDHIKPLSKGGLHEPSNLQLLTPRDNLRKGSKYEE